MGRSYTVKDGKKVLVPTERQLAKIESAKKEETLSDANGFSGATFTDGEKQYMVNELKKFAAKELKEVMERGEATDTFLMKKTLEILEDMKKGISKDEVSDKKFKFNLEKLINNWANSEIEFCAVYDKNNRFLGINVGVSNTVAVNIYQGQLAGGTAMHNHPLNTQKGRVLGGSFSLGDFKSMKTAGSRREVVTSREGVYELKASKNLKFKDKDVTIAYLKINARIAQMEERLTKSGYNTDTYNRLYWLELHNGVKDFCSKHGIQYKFTPNKGFEDLTDESKVHKPLPPLK